MKSFRDYIADVFKSSKDKKFKEVGDDIDRLVKDFDGERAEDGDTKTLARLLAEFMNGTNVTFFQRANFGSSKNMKLVSGILNKMPEINFPNLLQISDNAMNEFFKGNNGTSSVKFPSLKVVKRDGLNSAFRDSSVKKISFPHLEFVDTLGLFHTFENCKNLRSIEFPHLRRVQSAGMQYAFKGCSGIKSLSFPELRDIGQRSFFGILRNSGIEEIHFRSELQGHDELSAKAMGCSVADVKILFDIGDNLRLPIDALNGDKGYLNLTTIGRKDYVNTFVDNQYSKAPFEALDKIEFPNLKTIQRDGLRGFLDIRSKDGITGAYFPSLITIEKDGLHRSFADCSDLKVVSMPKLQTIKSGGLMSCFVNCKSLEHISFPSLKTIEGSGLDGAFSGCTNLKTIEFPKSLEGSIQTDRITLRCPRTTEIKFNL